MQKNKYPAAVQRSYSVILTVSLLNKACIEIITDGLYTYYFPLGLHLHIEMMGCGQRKEIVTITES